MYKYINSFANFLHQRPIPDRDPYTPMTNEEIDQYISKFPVPHLPEALRELMQLIGYKPFEDAFEKLVHPLDSRMWRKKIIKYIDNPAPYFVLDAYLDSFAAFIFLDGSDNPPIYAYFDYYEGRDCETFEWHSDLQAYYTFMYTEFYEAFLERLAGRTVLQSCVENAQAIFKPLQEKLIQFAGISEMQEIQEVRLSSRCLKWVHKDLFYDVYSPRYHADFSLWHKEISQNNGLVIKYLREARPHIAAINPLYSQIVDELEADFSNFATQIDEVAAAPDATVRQPSQAAKNAANEQRDITDFLI